MTARESAGDFYFANYPEPCDCHRDYMVFAEAYAAHVRQQDAQTIAELKLALGLSLELHGCDGDNCTEAEYVKDIQEFMETLGDLRETIAAKDAEIARLMNALEYERNSSPNDKLFRERGTRRNWQQRAEAAEQRAGALTAALNGYDLKRYAHTFRRMKEGLAEAVLLINGMIERDNGCVEHWRFLAQTCDSDHLATCANKLDAAIREEEK